MFLSVPNGRVRTSWLLAFCLAACLVPALVWPFMGLAADASRGRLRTVRIASEGARPPYNYLENNKLAGFEIDLGRDLCARMRVSCSFTAQDWDGLLPGLLAHRYDAIMAAMEIKPKDRVQTVPEFMQRLGQPLKPSVIHQGLQGLFWAKVAPSNPQVDKQIAEQAAKIAAAEKQAKLERQRREQESQAIKKQLQQLEADKQRLAREQQKAESERQQRQRAEREAQAAREQLQQSEAEKQRLANELQRANAEKERQAQTGREANIKVDQERQARDAQIKEEQAKRKQNEGDLESYFRSWEKQIEAERAKREQNEQGLKPQFNISEKQLQNIELRSAKGIDYRELEKLLKAQEWRSADELTAKLMCRFANREEEGWLDTKRIKTFPCVDLRTIDQLWVHYSNSKFGFSIQGKVLLEVGGEIGKYDFEVWKKFGAKVVWYHPQNNEWRAYTEFMNDTKNAKNALPASLPLGLLVRNRHKWTLGGFEAGFSLAQRLVDCN